MVLRTILSELSYVGELVESTLNLLMRSIASGIFIGCKRLKDFTISPISENKWLAAMMENLFYTLLVIVLFIGKDKLPNFSRS